MAIGDANSTMIAAGVQNRQPSSGVEERVFGFYTALGASNAEQPGYYDGSTMISFYSENSRKAPIISTAAYITNSVYFRKDEDVQSFDVVCPLSVYQTNS
tara:strand:- start:189 stop:488 length:300 start_codon:yes stop_codon:yes gene_type:complete